MKESDLVKLAQELALKTMVDAGKLTELQIIRLSYYYKQELNKLYGYKENSNVQTEN